jgi:2'-hydroxyisoflavone reductase
MLEGIQNANNSKADFTWVNTDFLEAQKVAPWSDMPVWVPPRGEEAGMGRINIQRAVGKGLTFRPLATTARDTLAWFKSQPPERQKLKAGITAEREAEVLAEWHKQKPT